MSSPRRTVHCADALTWLPANPLPSGHAILTSLPDVAEFRRRDPEVWRAWFLRACALVLHSTPADSAAILYQTDVKRAGTWIDKSFLAQFAAEEAGVALLWHKVVCRAPAGTATSGRPGYAHLLCFARELRDDTARATPDVLPRLGAMTWPRAMGLEAAAAAVLWLRDHAGARCIVDPFCGVGTALAVANQHGLDAIGIERSPSRAAKARVLTL